MSFYLADSGLAPDWRPGPGEVESALAIPLTERSDTQWLTIARGVSGELQEGAAHRAIHDEAPLAALERLKQTGLSVIAIPRASGGGGVRWPVAVRAVREIAAGDGSVGTLLAYHLHNTIHLRRESDERRAELEREVVAGRLWLSGIGNPLDGEIVLSPEGDDSFLLDGRKTFCTGAVFADRLSISARRADNGEIVRVSLPADREGITYGNDWDALGLRQSESGSFTLASVKVAANEISKIKVGESADFATNIHVPVNQSVFAQFYLGFALGALRAARSYLHEQGRPWVKSEAKTASQDALVLQRFGEFAVSFEAAVALADRAAEHVQVLLDSGPAFSAEQRGRAAIAVASAKVQATRTSLEITAGIYEVMGARATHSRHAFDRFWRDARTHTLHDPVAWRVREVAAFALNGELPVASVFS